MTGIPIVNHDDIPGDFKSLGIHRTKEEAVRHYTAWKKAKPNYPFMISVMKHNGDVWYSVWTKTQKNSKKKGVGMKPKPVGSFGKKNAKDKFFNVDYDNNGIAINPPKGYRQAIPGTMGLIPLDKRRYKKEGVYWKR